MTERLMTPAMRRRLRWQVGLAVFLTIWVLTTRGKYSVSGDEPHYLIICESVVSDGDLDLRNNYLQNDGRLFGHDGLRDDGHTRVTAHGALWSKHDVGLPFLLLPVYTAATRAASHAPQAVLARVRMTQGLFAYSLVSLTLVFATAFAATRLLDALIDLTGGRAVAVATGVTLAVALTPPVLAHAFLVFPETVAFVAVCCTVRAMVKDPVRLGRGEVAVIAVALGSMPWLHRKYTPFVVGLAFVLVVMQREWFRRQARRTLAALAALFLGPQCALHAWTYWAWHDLGGPQLMDDSRFSMGSFKSGVIGLWLDREYGLAAYSPIYLLALPAIALAPRRLWWLFTPLLLLYLPMAAFTEWWAGFSPAARYVMPLTPLIAALAVRAFDTRLMRWAGAATLVLQAIFWIAVVPRPRNLWPHLEGLNRPVAAIPFIGPLYEWFLPSLAVAPDRWTITRCLIMVVVFASLLVASARLERSRRLDRSGPDPSPGTSV